MKILVLNSGSSSQKTCLYEIGDSLPENPPAPLWKGQIEFQGTTGCLRIRTSQGGQVEEMVHSESRGRATEQLLDHLWSGPASALRSPSEIDIVGHRIVNGGRDYQEPAFLTRELKAAIEKMAVFAPLHNRVELDGMKAIEQKLGSVTQVAVFDTAFHSHLPDAAAIYPGPFEWVEQGIRRFGFHGINHQYCAGRAGQLLRKDWRSLRLVTCHLGNGCSLAAIREGRSIDTTMGFTPLEGLMMGTRSGSVDPGILTYLMRSRKLSGTDIDEALNKHSGLLGISGISGDMREILAAMAQGDPRAKLAFDIFIHRLVSGIGSMVAVLGGIDALVFTAGIGENSPEVRAAVCANFEFLEVALDPAQNAGVSADADISTPRSRVRVLMLRAQEDWAIARECWKLASARIRLSSQAG
jgi:acetate kinase